MSAMYPKWGVCARTDAAHLERLAKRDLREEPRHVLVREIYYVRDLVRTRRDPAGRPVEIVRITFDEEWMARQERRPLLDAGARVYFRGSKAGELIEIKD